MSDGYPVDENGVEVRSMVKKVVEPRPDPEDLTRVRTGDGATDYAYVDPATLFALERYVPEVLAATTPAERADLRARYKKYTRDVGDAAAPHWPAAGYVVRLGSQTGAYDSDVAGLLAPTVKSVADAAAPAAESQPPAEVPPPQEPPAQTGPTWGARALDGSWDFRGLTLASAQATVAEYGGEVYPDQWEAHEHHWVGEHLDRCGITGCDATREAQPGPGEVAVPSEEDYEQLSISGG